MNVAGLVAEYNPFHNGHAFHISETRRILGVDTAVVCVMSGCFVQRGDAAIWGKHARARAAVMSGADLVFELPLPWALSSAEGFARGAVEILHALGSVTHLSFGSECGDTSKLCAAAEALLRPEMNELILSELESGISYAAARQRALNRVEPELACLLETPNNILAIEYLKAMDGANTDILPVTVLRSGAGHDKRADGTGFRSASELRAELVRGGDISGHVPEPAYEIYRQEMKAGRGPVTSRSLETAILSRLRFLPAGAFDSIPGAAEGLGGRLYAAVRSEPTLDAVLSAAKTKRYALSRLRRMLFCAALGINAEMAEGVPPYARLLAANSRGRELLRLIQGRSGIEVVTRPSEIKKLSPQARGVFELESGATDLYVLGYEAREERRGGSDWRTSPAIAEN